MKIYLSYRRQDSAGYAGALVDALAERYGRDSIFNDFAIEPGMDFRHHVLEALSSSDAILAVIGREWVHAVDRDGRRRLDDPEDFVRNELRTALKLQKLLVPVLVGGAKVPSSTELPTDIAALSNHHAVSLDDKTWARDVSLLTKRLDTVAGVAGSKWTRWFRWQR
jgi:hypothetical protein